MAQPTPAILWRQVWGLSALLTAILIGFKAYELYQPQILTQLGFLSVVGSLGVIQGVLGAIVEPCVGGFSDRILRHTGSRLPQIVVGITLAGLIFVGVALFINTGGLLATTFLVLVMMLFWLIAMIAVRGPAVALLRQFAPVEQLPHANAVLILVLGLVGAINPLLEILLKQWGASPTFIVGAIALLLGTALLFSTTPQHTLPLPPRFTSQTASFRLLCLIFLIGVGASLEMILLMSVFTHSLQAQLKLDRIEWILTPILLLSALSANPMSELTTRLGAAKAMQIGLGVIVLGMGVTLFNNSQSVTIGLIVGLGLAMGLMFISIIPFCLASVPLTQAGLSTGLYFGGGGFASAIAAFLQSQTLHPFNAFCWAIICFTVTTFCLQVSRRILRQQNKVGCG